MGRKHKKDKKLMKNIRVTEFNPYLKYEKCEKDIFKYQIPKIKKY